MSSRVRQWSPNPSFLLILLPYVLLCPLTAIAQTTVSPPELFKRLAPSVFVVEILGANGSVIAIGSGVAVASNQVVTNKHVVDGALSIRVRKGEKTWAARVTHLDPNHDLCRLSAEGLDAPPVTLRVSSTLQVGERVYTIGAPQGLELTFSEGLISALRDYDGVRIIQTSAAISEGSSGGGLFDERGKLVGITTFLVKDGQNLNFALPSEWASALDKHAVSSPPTGPNDDPQSQALAWFILGYDYGKAGDHEKEGQAYREAIRLKPDFVAVWFNLGGTYGELGQHNQAIQAYREAIRLKPDFADTWYNLGGTYGELGQHNQAIQAYREAIRLRPDFADAWTNLGVNYGRLGQSNQEIEAYREAIRIKPDFADAWNKLGYSYATLGQYEQSIQAFREAVRLKPDNANAWFLLGICYYAKGNRSKVMEVYQQLKLLDAEMADKFFNKFVLP